MKNSAGKDIIKVNQTKTIAEPNSITQKTNAKGGIDQNFMITMVDKLFKLATMTSYNLEDIKSRLLEFSGLMSFEYNGLYCDIDPFNKNNFHVTCNGNEHDMKSIDDVLNSPVFGGCALNEIWDKIKILDW